MDEKDIEIKELQERVHELERLIDDLYEDMYGGVDNEKAIPFPLEVLEEIERIQGESIYLLGLA